MGVLRGDDDLTLDCVPPVISAWSFGYFLGSPIAGYLLEAGGGPEGGMDAFRGESYNSSLGREEIRYLADAVRLF